MRVFHYLHSTNKSYSEISRLTKVGPSAIRHIISGNSHLWLEEEYSENYLEIKLRRLKPTYYFKSPDGTEISGKSFTKIAKEYNVPGTYARKALAKLAKGEARFSSYKGYSFERTEYK